MRSLEIRDRRQRVTPVDSFEEASMGASSHREMSIQLAEMREKGPALI